MLEACCHQRYQGRVGARCCAGQLHVALVTARNHTPVPWQALYRRGQAYAAQGDPSAAVPDLAAALAASPAAEKPAIAEKLAAARQAAGMSAEAADEEATDQIEEVRPGLVKPSISGSVLQTVMTLLLPSSMAQLQSRE